MVPQDCDSKAQLFAAAVRVFAEKGFKAATVRDICAEAGAANPSAVSYHFGGKAKLYHTVLDALFAELGRGMAQSPLQDPSLTPCERLRAFLHTYCRLLYQGDPLTEAFLRIHAMEMANPSPHLPEMIARHLAPQTREQWGLIADVLGVAVSQQTLADCLAAIVGQAAYYAFTRPLYAEAFPELVPASERWAELADQVWRFSLAGLADLRTRLEKEPEHDR